MSTDSLQYTDEGFIWLWHQLAERWAAVDMEWRRIADPTPAQSDDFDNKLSRLQSELDRIGLILVQRGWSFDRRYQVWVKG